MLQKTESRLHCPRCDYTEVETNVRVADLSDRRFSVGVTVGLAISSVTLLVARLIGWVQ